MLDKNGIEIKTGDVEESPGRTSRPTTRSTLWSTATETPTGAGKTIAC